MGAEAPVVLTCDDFADGRAAFVVEPELDAIFCEQKAVFASGMIASGGEDVVPTCGDQSGFDLLNGHWVSPLCVFVSMSKHYGIAYRV